MSSNACAAVAIAFLIATAAQAESSSPTAQAPPGLTDMQTGRFLLRAGRLEHARAFLRQARPSEEEEEIERLFLLGQIEMRLGLPRQAAERFEAILVRRPGLTRVRLELARAYYLTGRDDKAKYHFGLSMGDKLPSSVEATVEGFLRRIDARKRWSVSVSAAILPETNPARRTKSEEVRIGNVPFRLDEDARSSSGVGKFVAGGVSFSPVIVDDLRAAFAASGAANLHERSDWNDISLSGDIGLTLLSDRGSVSGGLRLGRRWLGGDPDHRSLGPWARLGMRLSNSTRLDMDISALHRKHDTRTFLNGWRIAVRPTLRYTLDAQTLIEAEPTIEVASARAEHNGSRQIGFGVTASRAFDGGFSASVNPAFHARRYKDRHPLFGRQRVDLGVRIGVRVLHRSVQYAGFAPYVGYSFERTRSNIQIYGYRNHGAIFGVTRSF